MTDREVLLSEIWKLQHEIYDLIIFYGGAPYRYGEISIYQAEGEILNKIAEHPGITVTELGKILNKTTSACSQTVSKLRIKGIVEQRRNPENPQQNNLVLTELGTRIQEDRFNKDVRSWERTTAQLEDISETELEILLKVQRRINRNYLAETGT